MPCWLQGEINMATLRYRKLEKAHFMACSPYPVVDDAVCVTMVRQGKGYYMWVHSLMQHLRRNTMVDPQCIAADEKAGA